MPIVKPICSAPNCWQKYTTHICDNIIYFFEWALFELVFYFFWNMLMDMGRMSNICSQTQASSFMLRSLFKTLCSITMCLVRLRSLPYTFLHNPHSPFFSPKYCFTSILKCFNSKCRIRATLSLKIFWQR